NRNLRRTRRRTFFHRVLRAARLQLRFVLSISRADCALGGGAGRRECRAKDGRRTNEVGLTTEARRSRRELDRNQNSVSPCVSVVNDFQWNLFCPPLLLLLHALCSPPLVSRSSIPINRHCGTQD